MGEVEQMADDRQVVFCFLGETITTNKVSADQSRRFISLTLAGGANRRGSLSPGRVRLQFGRRNDGVGSGSSARASARAAA